MHRMFFGVKLAVCLVLSAVFACKAGNANDRLFAYKAPARGYPLIFTGNYPPTFNANTYVPAYSGAFGYGTNMGYYGDNWSDDQIAAAFRSVGGNTLRVSLPEKFLRSWGYGVRGTTFRNYRDNMGLNNLTAIVGEPSDAVRDRGRYNGYSESNVFANLYQPIWNGDGTVNQNNYYAWYIYQAVLNYGDYIRFWEVMNEPDFSPGTNTDNWYTRNPSAGELPNIRAPFTYYVRMLRIAYEVIKNYKPNDYVAIGGIGYDSFLDAVLRNTDNPDNGAVTGEYPQKGGAYFDVLSYHYYPIYALKSWNNSTMNFNYHRHSDAAVKATLDHKDLLENTLKKHGYGSSYPQKHVIITETNVGRKSTGGLYGGNEYQRNYVMKMLVQAQKYGIKKVDFFMAGETANYDQANNENQVMGFFENMFRDAPGSQKMTLSGIGHKSLAELLNGYSYDAPLTTRLNLPADVEGAAFSNGREVYYVLYAKTSTDMNEWNTAQYSFPEDMRVKTLTGMDWNYSVTGQKNTINGASLQLGATPAVYRVSETWPQNGNTLTAAINYKYYETNSTWWSLPDFSQLAPVITGKTPAIDLSVSKRAENYGVLYESYINIPVSGNYTFETYSDDGSKLFIGPYSANGNAVVYNDGSHGMQFREGTVYLSKGVYPIAVAYMQGVGASGLQVYWKNTAHGVVQRQLIPQEYFVDGPGTAVAAAEPANISYSYYEAPEYWWSLPDYKYLTPLKTGKTSTPDLGMATRAEHYGVLYEGYIRIPATGYYTFGTNSDDGSRFYLNGYDSYDYVIVDNNGSHAARMMEGTRYLTAGTYPFYLTYMQNTGPATLELYWRNTAHGVVERQPIPKEYFVAAPGGVTRLAVSKTALSGDMPNSSTTASGIYPNPVNDRINLKLGQDFTGKKSIKLLLSDAGGHLLKSESFNNANAAVQMDLRGLNLNTGVYFLQVSGDQAKAKTFKVIKR